MTSPAGPSAIEVHDQGAVRVLAFNRPEARNAFNQILYHEACAALETAGSDSTVRVLVLTGNGPVFSAGQDLKEMRALAAGELEPGVELGFRSLLAALESFPKPLVAAVNGPAVGLGFTLLPHCDFVLVSDSTRARVPFAELGVPAEAGSSFTFPRTLGFQQAARALLGAEWFSAEELVRYGVALKVCADDELGNEAMALAEKLAAFNPDALHEIKRLMRASHADLLARARDREEEAFGRLLGSAANLAALDAAGPNGAR